MSFSHAKPATPPAKDSNSTTVSFNTNTMPAEKPISGKICKGHKRRSNKSRIYPSSYKTSLVKNMTSPPVSPPNLEISNVGVRQADVIEPQDMGHKFKSLPAFINLKHVAIRAVMDGKTFTVLGWFVIRDALVKRGWVEKFDFSGYYLEEVEELNTKELDELLPMLQETPKNALIEQVIKSKIIANFQVDFCWGVNNAIFTLYPPASKTTMLNLIPFRGCCFTSKTSLAQAAKAKWWNNHPYGAFRYNHPRSFTLSRSGETKEFQRNFRLTACISIISWVIRVYKTHESKILTAFGQIPLHVFDFAVQRCTQFLRQKETPILDFDWEIFLDYFHKLVHIGNHFKTDEKAPRTEASLVDTAKKLQSDLKKVYPFFEMDGVMNTWILKPLGGQRGDGIFMFCNLKDVDEIMKAHQGVIYVAQKYLERPFLVYGTTKFDIRQWFLVGSVVPLNIWRFTDFYLRFSCRTFNLRKLHESVHLTNHSVQIRYTDNEDMVLPTYNMWHSNEFKDYLTNIGYPHVFERIVNGMCEAIVAVVTKFVHNFINRRSCFQLFGADFMITDDFTPWLIEVNWYPDMSYSTPVTATMCGECLNDVLKVVIDYEKDHNANTGKFDLIYQEPNPLLKHKGRMKLAEICTVRKFKCHNEIQAESKPEVVKKTLSPILSESSLQDVSSIDEIVLSKSTNNEERKKMSEEEVLILKELMKRMDEESVEINQKLQHKTDFKLEPNSTTENTRAQLIKLEKYLDGLVKNTKNESQSNIITKLYSQIDALTKLTCDNVKTTENSETYKISKPLLELKSRIELQMQKSKPLESDDSELSNESLLSTDLTKPDLDSPQKARSITVFLNDKEASTQPNRPFKSTSSMAAPFKNEVQVDTSWLFLNSQATQSETDSLFKASNSVANKLKDKKLSDFKTFFNDNREQDRFSNTTAHKIRNKPHKYIFSNKFKDSDTRNKFSNTNTFSEVTKSTSVAETEPKVSDTNTVATNRSEASTSSWTTQPKVVKMNNKKTWVKSCDHVQRKSAQKNSLMVQVSHEALPYKKKPVSRVRLMFASVKTFFHKRNE